MPQRKIVRRTRGNRHGPITRLMSPSDLGQLLKPFVFLDHFDLQGAAGGTELHPHSGIATVTYLFEGTIRYEDSNGAKGVVPAGGVEWFKAAHGAWHAGGPESPAVREASSSGSHCRPSRSLGRGERLPAPDAVAHEARRGSCVGAHGRGDKPAQPRASSIIWQSACQRGIMAIPTRRHHTVGWLSLSTGRVRVPELVDAGELAILDSSSAAVDVAAEADTEFVIGSAIPHPHDLALGKYSVHTSPATLRAGEQRLQEIQRRLQSEGRL